jgi:hypothetical protein
MQVLNQEEKHTPQDHLREKFSLEVELPNVARASVAGALQAFDNPFLRPLQAVGRSGRSGRFGRFAVTPPARGNVRGRLSQAALRVRRAGASESTRSFMQVPGTGSSVALMRSSVVMGRMEKVDGASFT